MHFGEKIKKWWHKPQKQYTYIEKVTMISLFIGLGTCCLDIGLVAEFNILISKLLNKPLKTLYPQYLLPFGIFLVVCGFMAVHYVEKREKQELTLKRVVDK
jgi:uncharacterized BrkB/YihY/UPF0761 family membrane protein